LPPVRASSVLEDVRRLYESFTEGLDTRDLREAKALLEH
jgi:hypothetical protein